MSFKNVFTDAPLPKVVKPVSESLQIWYFGQWAEFPGFEAHLTLLLLRQVVKLWQSPHGLNDVVLVILIHIRGAELQISFHHLYSHESSSNHSLDLNDLMDVTCTQLKSMQSSGHVIYCFRTTFITSFGFITAFIGFKVSIVQDFFEVFHIGCRLFNIVQFCVHFSHFFSVVSFLRFTSSLFWIINITRVTSNIIMFLWSMTLITFSLRFLFQSFLCFSRRRRCILQWKWIEENLLRTFIIMI